MSPVLLAALLATAVAVERGEAIAPRAFEDLSGATHTVPADRWVVLELIRSVDW